MSLADELLADLEEAAGEEEEEEAEGSEGGEGPIEEVREEPEAPEGGESVRSIAKLWGSRGFAEIMQKIEEYIGKQPRAAEVLGPVEAAPEYRVIVDANNLTVEIENELNIIHKFIRDKYSKRFPELESLVPNALDYIRTVKELGNSLDKCKNNENVQQILTNATIMVVSVTASTTQGQQLSEEELGRIEDACDMALALSGAKLRIYEYVESRMSFIAPNLSLILGASTAAKIMGPAQKSRSAGGRQVHVGSAGGQFPREPGRKGWLRAEGGDRAQVRQVAGAAPGQAGEAAAGAAGRAEEEEGGPALPEDEGAPGADGDSQAGQQDELWGDRGGRLPGGPGLQPGPPGQGGQRPRAPDSGQRGHQGSDQQNPAEDAAEAERGVRRQIHHPRPQLGDGLQRGLHPPAGSGDREPAGGREESGRGQPEIFLQHGRVPQGQGRKKWGPHPPLNPKIPKIFPKSSWEPQNSLGTPKSPTPNSLLPFLSIII
nr:U4/U6 small nuclear ribonucleoprotein Prp31 isoform X4 [Taeniopygia guttata]